MDSDDMYGPPDWYIERLSWDECEKCGESIPPYQDFCYKCLSVDAKWKLGVL